ncbi:cytochrome c biogenesis protein ResB [Gryllotalpicola sp.]|uniref:cytochrome c biogenesis protein ResB n=1 Tax=Gryllotalpicola sp. TaxID=1932787 RepID=UPI002604730C|nr:cytochrome c biogenesis protein ResB [Gryllotalpicola sp.]
MAPSSESAERVAPRVDYLPSGHADAADGGDGDGPVTGGRLGPVGWARWFWRQLTSMRTALFLLMLLALAAVPGSLVPQHISDPNGVLQYQRSHPTLYPILNAVQLFDTYTSVWFSAIYLLLFASLIGCIIPRITHHVKALRAQPPRTPARLARMAGYRALPAPAGVSAEAAIESARGLLRKAGYRVVTLEGRDGLSVSAERGYLRETGNLVFHIALVGILLAVGIGGGFGWTAQRVVVEGQTFVNTAVNFDSFNPGRFVSSENLPAYSVTLDKFTVKYDQSAGGESGMPLDYNAQVVAREKDGASWSTSIKVNSPLQIDGTNVYLLGNGYAPALTFRDAAGKVIASGPTPFLPQDANLTSQGIIKIAGGLKQQLGIIGIFTPTAPVSTSARPLSTYPDTRNPRVSLTVFAGDLGLDAGVPVSVFALNTDHLTQIAGPNATTGALNLGVGETAQLPDGLGTVTFDGVKRFASLDIHHDPAQGWVLVFAILVVAGLLTSLFVPRRRLWVKAVDSADGLRLEYAGLARGEDARLEEVVADLQERHFSELIGGKG